MNVLLILADQLAADVLSCAGNRFAETPNLDRLAAASARFATAYCSAPMCVPSRSALLYGRTPHQLLLPGTEVDFSARIGDPGRGVRPEYRAEELGKLLNAAGYRCAYAGKWHVGQWGPTESLCSNTDTGFESLSPIDDHAVPEACARFLQTAGQKPFFLVASFDNPHNIHEWVTQQALPWGEIGDPPAREHLPPLPANFPASPREPRAIRDWRDRLAGELRYRPDDWRRYRWAYDRLVEKLDRQVGRLLHACSDAGLDDRTMVIFTSDHGDQRGAHELAFKSVMYDESARVPLFLRRPDGLAAGCVCDLPVDVGLDVYATVCEAAGVTPPHGNGVGLEPVTRGHRPDRPCVVTAFHHPRIGQRMRMVRSARYKYVLYELGPVREQLFDMQADPGEMVNLADCHPLKDVLKQHRAYLRGWMAETGDGLGGGHYTHPQTPRMLPGDAYISSD